MNSCLSILIEKNSHQGSFFSTGKKRCQVGSDPAGAVGEPAIAEQVDAKDERDARRLISLTTLNIDISGMIAEKKSAAWSATTNITSKSVFGFLSATSLELQMLEVCKAMGCSFEQDDSIRPKQYIGKFRFLFPLSSTRNSRARLQLQPSKLLHYPHFNPEDERC